jgi:uncharacterized protein YbaR (Trm112 family)
MPCPVNRWPVYPQCPKCDEGDDEKLLITEIAVERTGYIVVTIYCSECKVAYNVPYFIPQLLSNANDEDEKIKQSVPEITGTWRAYPSGKPN